MRLLHLLALAALFLNLGVAVPMPLTASSLVWARSSADSLKKERGPARKKPSRVKGTPATMMPATVRDFRVMSSDAKTRLVLDLDRETKVVERRSTQPQGIVLVLPNTALSASARVKTEDGSVPPPFLVTQQASSVVVTLPTDAVRSYKHFTLSTPPRLVVDIMTPSDPPISAAPGGSPSIAVPAAPLIQPAAPPSKGYRTIVIDPGHGGKDPGARGLRHTEEKDITLKVGLKLRDLLSKQPGLRVLMTRDHDVFVELEDRAKFANSNEADLFVSIHVNSHPSRQVRGIEIYHFGEAKDQRALEVAARENGTPLSSTGVGWEYLVADLLTTKKIEASLELAWTAKEAMVARMNGHYALNDHGVKTAPFYVLRFTSMPSILAEIAYISNPTEEQLLRSPAFVRDVAESLYQGVNAYLANNKSALR